VATREGLSEEGGKGDALPPAAMMSASCTSLRTSEWTVCLAWVARRVKCRAILEPPVMSRAHARETLGEDFQHGGSKWHKKPSKRGGSPPITAKTAIVVLLREGKERERGGGDGCLKQTGVLLQVPYKR
jgi:hypothetical protein